MTMSIVESTTDRMTGTAEVILPEGMTVEEAARLVREADEAQALKDQECQP